MEAVLHWRVQCVLHLTDAHGKFIHHAFLLIFERSLAMTTPPTNEQPVDPLQHRLEELNQTLLEQAEHLREQVKEAREKTRDYIQHEPVKSVLIAAATGAALVLLTHWVNQRVK
jgi:hypothetical protein